MATPPEGAPSNGPPDVEATGLVSAPLNGFGSGRLAVAPAWLRASPRGQGSAETPVKAEARAVRLPAIENRPSREHNTHRSRAGAAVSNQPCGYLCSGSSRRCG
jgi:hypothetical protein